MGLRATLRKIASERKTLVIGQGTAGADFIRQAAIRMSISFELVCAEHQPNENDSDLPRRDLAVLEAAETVYVLGLRTNGNMHRLLRERVQCPDASTVLVDLPGLQAESARNELITLGAIIWQPSISSCAPFETGSNPPQDMSRDVSTDQRIYEIAPFPLTDDWNLLTHTTRSCPGPWPGESFEAYADSLFESLPEADHSALGTLQRIVAQRRLMASGQTIREGHRVVSFTACPLKDLLSLHRFRAHRVRWDFEPYGLCIRREWLQNRGARPVIYGDDNCWESLSESDRPFFQIAIGATVIDWSVEREWRHLGDLDLTELTSEDALLFVPDFEAAKSVAKLISWPVTLLPLPEAPVV